MELTQCPKCGEELQVRKGKFGEFLGCPNFQECGFKGAKIEGDKPTGGFKKILPGNEEVLKGLREVYKELKLLREDFKIFTDAFVETPEKSKYSQKELKDVYDSDESRWN